MNDSDRRQIKDLGVFLGEESVFVRNWKNVLEKTEGRLEKWMWLFSPKHV